VRIVSLLPSVTEIVAALGLEESLVGRTHECDFPPSVASVPVLTRSLIAHDPGDSAGIDRAVSQAVSGDGLYELDREGLAAARPDIVITQELCDVCAVGLDEVRAAADALPGEVEVLSLAPETLDGVLASIVAIGEILGASGQAARLVAGLRARLARVREAVAGRPKPRVAVLEWLDPPYAAGHWVPDQVAASGGQDVLGRSGRPSVRVRHEAVLEADPDILVLAPCGWSADQAAAAAAATPAVMAALLGARAVREGRVVALDANALVSRPGPRLVAGVEILAALLHPDAGLPAPPPEAVREVRLEPAGRTAR
jgi:iron complex transport system substrate-binding protein